MSGLAVSCRGIACFLPEEFAEKGYIGEMELFGKLIDRFVTVPQLDFRLLDNSFVDPFHDSPSACLTDKGTHVAGRDTELVGIKPDVPFLDSMVVYQFDETVEHFYLPQSG